MSHVHHAKATESQGTPGGTSDPLAVYLVPRLPRKSGGAPRDAKAYIRVLPEPQERQSDIRPLAVYTAHKGCQGVHQTPWQCTLSHACHAKAAEPQGTPGLYPIPWQCILFHTSRKSGGAPRDARAYIPPLGSVYCSTSVIQKRRSSGDARA